MKLPPNSGKRLVAPAMVAAFLVALSFLFPAALYYSFFVAMKYLSTDGREKVAGLPTVA